MGKVLVIGVAFVALVALLAGRGGSDRDAFASCLEDRGVLARESDEWEGLYASAGMPPGIGEEIDKHTVSLVTTSSEGIAVVTDNDGQARQLASVFTQYLHAFTTQRAGNVVVAWVTGPEPADSSVVSSCA